MRRKTKVRDRIEKVLLVSGAVLFSLALAELVTRAYFPFRNYTPRLYVFQDQAWPWCQPAEHSRIVRSRFMPTGTATFLLPNHDFAHQYPYNYRGYFDARSRIDYHNNNLGFRGPDIVPEDARDTGDRLQVVLLGDSFTYGEGVRLEDTFGRVMEDSLRSTLQPMAVQFVNMAQPGFNTVNEVDCWETYGPLVKPDLVILAFSPNDVLLPAVQEDAERNVTGRYLSMFKEPTGVERHVQLLRLARIALNKYYIDSTMRPVTKADLSAVGRDGHSAWDLCSSALGRLNDDVHAAGAVFMIVILPLMDGLAGAYPFAAIHESVRAFGAAHDVPVVDLLPLFAGRREADLWVHPVDHHPNDAAHAMIARGILQDPGFGRLIERIRERKNEMRPETEKILH